MDIMTLALVILAVCTLVQLGFFLFDRWQAYQFRKLMPTVVGRTTYLGSKGVDLFLIYLGSAALGYLVGKLIHRYLYELES